MLVLEWPNFILFCIFLQGKCERMDSCTYADNQCVSVCMCMY